MNDMYEADYNPEKPLYASAAYINRACAKNYTLSALELQKEMGALDGLVSQQVKNILFPSSKKEHMYRLIRRYIEPYKQQIKYGLGALTLGALSYAAYKTLPKIYNSALLSDTLNRLRPSPTFYSSPTFSENGSIWAKIWRVTPKSLGTK